MKKWSLALILSMAILAGCGSNQSSAQTTEANVEVKDNRTETEKSGGSGSIVVPRTDTRSIVIPQSACTTVQDKIFVYKVDKNNKLHYTEITVNPQNDGKNYVVTGGLKIGDQIVSNGITKLTDQMTIIPISQERYEKKIQEQAKSMTAGDIVNGMKK